MIENFRRFEVGPDPAGRTWNVELQWLQTAVSIRHSDSVDVKFRLSAGAAHLERVVALAHPALLRLAEGAGRHVTDPWCMRLAALHIEHMILTGDDFEKPLVAPSLDELEAYNRQPAPLLR